MYIYIANMNQGSSSLTVHCTVLYTVHCSVSLTSKRIVLHTNQPATASYFSSTCLLCLLICICFQNNSSEACFK